jgi:uncharacterized repeat protein (TIGR03803 family)
MVLAGAVAGAQPFEVVHSFTKDSPSSGPWPAWAPTELVRGPEGLLLGATQYGGEGCTTAVYGSQCGVVFELHPVTGATRVLHEFGFTQSWQTVRLEAGDAGEIYGTESNNPSMRGRLFKLTPTADGPWESTVLHTFGTDTPNQQAYLWNYDGRGPHGPAILAADGRLYGTTLAGGGLSNHQAQGSLYRIYPDGSGYESLYAFHTDNLLPSGIVGLSPMGALVTGADGHLYGTAFYGGSRNPDDPGYGTIFRYRGDTGTVEKVHSFDDTRVAYAPQAGLVRGPGGALFGVTSGSGSSQPSGSGSGTIFRMTVAPEVGAQAAVTILHTFEHPSDANMPSRELVLAPDGFLYGAAWGGAHNKGVVFRIRPGGSAYEHVHDFSGEDGANPASGLVVASDGHLYGVTRDGGAGSGGVVYRIRISARSTIEGLIERVEGLIDDGTLKLGQGKSLIGKLELALYMLEWGNTKKAITMLEAFIHEVKAFRNAGILEPDEADPMIAIAEGTIASITG